MNYLSYLSVIAFSAGAAIAIQASMNAQLGVFLKSPLLATCVAFISSVLFTSVAIVVQVKEFPSVETLRSVPIYLWISGGLFSAFGVSMFYFLIPKMGIGPMMSFALSGQLIIAMIAGHYGWFDLPHRPMTSTKMLGLLALIAGILLINKE